VGGFKGPRLEEKREVKAEVHHPGQEEKLIPAFPRNLRKEEVPEEMEEEGSHKEFEAIVDVGEMGEGRKEPAVVHRIDHEGQAHHEV